MEFGACKISIVLKPIVVVWLRSREIATRSISCLACRDRPAERGQISSLALPLAASKPANLTHCGAETLCVADVTKEQVEGGLLSAPPTRMSMFDVRPRMMLPYKVAMLCSLRAQSAPHQDGHISETAEDRNARDGQIDASGGE